MNLLDYKINNFELNYRFLPTTAIDRFVSQNLAWCILTYMLVPPTPLATIINSWFFK